MGKEQMQRNFSECLKDKQLTVGIIGLGYAGLPLAMGFSGVGFHVIGIDSDNDKIEKLSARQSYLPHISDTEIKAALGNQFAATNDYSYVSEMDAIIICVPTPLSKTRSPDLSFIISAVKNLSKHLKKGQLVVLQSTTYPGTTREIVQPILEADGTRKAGIDFYLGYAPERVDPGNKKYGLANTPKVVSGITNACKSRTQALFQEVVDEVVLVSSTTCAELVKIHENTFRQINIALANELAIMCDYLKIDAWEVIEAASTKPFAFMPHYPGPGIGGDCIPVVPHFLTWKLKEIGYENQMIGIAHEINTRMKNLVINYITDSLNSLQKAVSGSKIVILGVSYKQDASDTRESASIDIVETLITKGAKVQYIDPFVRTLKIGEKVFKSKKWQASVLQKADCVVLLTAHTLFRKTPLWQHAGLIVDTRNIVPKGDNVVTLGAVKREQIA